MSKYSETEDIDFLFSSFLLWSDKKKNSVVNIASKQRIQQFSRSTYMNVGYACFTLCWVLWQDEFCIKLLPGTIVIQFKIGVLPRWSVNVDS